MNRSSGVLLHITSLPDGEGIGDLGASAHRFVEWLSTAGQTWWQVLPCGEVGFGYSPYQSRSSYAGNPMLISLQTLVEWNLLDDARPYHTDNTAEISFEDVKRLKGEAIALVAEQFADRASNELLAEYKAYVAGSDQHWLHDYARFTVLKLRFSDQAWTAWPARYAKREVAALTEFDAVHAKEIYLVKVTQFLFARQWAALRQHARSCDVQLIGDCPIYVAADSADVWCNPQLFDLADNGLPRVVAGVPPDYFSATGQLWGNPLYLWSQAEAENFAWWRARVKHCAAQFDLTRIDHFRGLDAYWEVPAEAEDASFGCWQPASGEKLLAALVEDYDELPLIAEDLGDLTQSVHDLRRRFGLLGMRVMQFGFDGGDDNPHSPENITEDVICYAGTHDNDTTLGWLGELNGEMQQSLLDRFDCSTLDSLCDALVDQVLGSPAVLAIMSMQDLLHLGSGARFNTPGTVGNNWIWRMASEDLTQSLAAQTKLRSVAANRAGAGDTSPVSVSMNSLTANKEFVGQPKALRG